jgi:hypothetical protein
MMEIEADMRVIKNITVILFVVFLLGCATNGSSIITGTVRPEIDPSEVKIYIDPPPQYETIGIVEAAREVGFSRQKTQDNVIEDLKILAAKMGANGVLLTATGSQPTGSTGGFMVGTSFGDVGVGVGSGSSGERIVGQGRAIYVIEESTPLPDAE